MRPKISVLMSAHNHAPFVMEAVQSVLAQTYAHFEFLIADDGSTDETPALLAGVKDTRVKLCLHEKNRGACVRTNELLRAARGKYVAIINSDDAFLPEKLAAQMDVLERSPRLLACFTYVDTMDAAGKSVPAGEQALFNRPGGPRGQRLKAMLFTGNTLCHPSILARRKGYGRYHEGLWQLPDYLHWVRLLKRGEVCVLAQPLTRFRVGVGNASADSPAVRVALTHELPVVYREFFSLSKEDCAAVFGATGNAMQRRALAAKALLGKEPCAQALAVAEMLRLGASKAGRAALAHAGVEDAHLLARQCDAYRVLPFVQRLYVESGGAFAEAAALPAGEGAFCHTFKVEKAAARLRFDPAERPCRVHLAQAVAHTSAGDVPLTPAGHNGAGEGVVEFCHEDGWFMFELAPCTVHAVTLAGEIYLRPWLPQG